MRAGRYDFSGSLQALHWPFAMHGHEVRVVPLIAPEFQASFARIVTTTRHYFHIEPRRERPARRQGSPRR